MSKISQAREVLVRLRTEVIGEIAICGSNGGTGRAQNYAPILVNVGKSLEILDELEKEVPQPEVSTADRMATMRAAKAAKQ